MPSARLPLVLSVAVLAASSGCRAHLDPDDARQLSSTPALAYTLVEEKPGRMDIMLPPGAPMEAMLEAFTVAAVTAGKYVRSSELPAVGAPGWYRATPPPVEGPLFDPANVLAASLLHHMVQHRLAQTAPTACEVGKACSGATLVLEAGLGQVRTALAGAPARIAFKGLEGEARLKTPEGRMVWAASCSVDAVELPPVPVQSQAHAAQLLFDAAALKCGEQLFDKLSAAMAAE